MEHFQHRSFPTRPQDCFYVVTSFVGGIIRNTSLLILLLWYGLASAAVGVHTAKSFWRHPEVRSFVAALEADFGDKDASTVNLGRKSPTPFKDLDKVQREENRARRKLAAEMKQPKASAGSVKAARQSGRII